MIKNTYIFRVTGIDSQATLFLHFVKRGSPPPNQLKFYFADFALKAFP